MESKQEPKVRCDTCHLMVVWSKVTPFLLRGTEYYECRDCEAKRLARKAK